MTKIKAFTLKVPHRINVLKTKCGVSDAVPLGGGSANPLVLKEYEAIWDTGATGTVITAKVAKELGLKPTGVVTSHHAGGSHRVNTYLVNIYLPNKINVVGVKVVEAILSGNTEMLIGMDIISLGDFAFTNFKGTSCFTFRIPSTKQIDYVQEDKIRVAKKNPVKSSYQRRGKGKGKGKGR
ncbi:retropepsin-like aspartic protease [Maribacter sp. Hel_I_7]|uniref:retropepsin-like aspartic protease n=1 Tax=Maribacter sp. Hel_I_7 TaxID=1249997 RepID=UPI00047A8F45|nr:retropepsin-like aspartic protease [Maribacter sp. Hel_I_7]